MPDDAVFRAILLVLVVSAIFGAALMLAGQYLLDAQGVVRLGTGIALVCGSLYFVFRMLGKRETRWRGANRGSPNPGQDEE